MNKGKEMRIIRTFHPVGQGAFYSERFYGEQKTFNVVYDCGTLHVAKSHKNLVRQSFSKDDIIDCLFISHLDEDHISLVSTLKDSVYSIKKVVLPLIDKDKVILQMFLSRMLGMVEVYEFWSMVHDAMIEPSTNDDIRDNSPYDSVYPRYDDNKYPHYDDKYSHIRPQLQFVKPNQNVKINPSIVYRNNTRIDPLVTDWLFVAYNKHIERQEELENNLKKIVADSEFQDALNHVGVTIKTVQDLKYILSTSEFVMLMGSRVIKEFLRKAYNDVAGAINSNSLSVYSGPSENSKLEFVMREHFSCDYRCLLSLPRYIPDRVACMYTGDSDLDMKGYKQEFQTLWTNVGTIQLPHHGSYGSFQFDKNKDEFDKLYVLPVSCGETNSYGHPSSKVLDFLMANDCLPVVVTENASTRYSQVIISK